MSPVLHVLHIVPHAGGGVGAVLRTLATALHEAGAVRSTIATLDTLNEETRAHCRRLGISWAENLGSTADRRRFDSLVAAADLVLVHWWNHPLLIRLMAQGLPPSRIVLWSHVNGRHPPQAFFRELFEFPDVFVMASEASLAAPVVEQLPDSGRDKLRVIRSCAGIPSWTTDVCAKNGPPRVGYIGTVEEAKMHRDFLRLCAAADLAEPCIVAGGPSHEALREQAVQLGVADRFAILGHVADPAPIYRQIHVFAYPLNPRHYGTGEQVLIEAMAAGCVPVVLDNPPERALVQHDETGLVARTADEFSRALRFLSEQGSERERLARAGRRFVLKQCGIDRSVAAFQALFDEARRTPKRPHRLVLPAITSVPEGSPCHLFLASCGEQEERHIAITMLSSPVAEEVIPASFRFTTRGSPRHYLDMLGHDKYLERICYPKSHCATRENVEHG